MNERMKTMKMPINNELETFRMKAENPTERLKYEDTSTAAMPSGSTTERILEDDPNPTLKMEDGIQATQLLETNRESNGYIQVGDQINQTYHLVKNLTYNTGEATLFICERAGTSFVAKVYHEHFMPKDEVSERIRSINSPYVIPIVDKGIDEQSNRYYEILPYYRNGDLAKQERFTIKQIVDMIIPSMNEGLKAIHDQGVVHRDIKPNNVFLSDDRSYVILGDFGISSTLDRGSVIFTGNANRTNGYAAPEVYNRLISKENDYYSFGITLLELALGVHPFKGLSEEQIMKVTLMDPITIPVSIPNSFAQLIKGLTRKDRNVRWGYEEVKRWLNGENVTVLEDPSIRTIRPYQFLGKEIDQLDELALAFAKNWHEAKKHLYRGLVSDFVKQFGQDYQLKVMECEEILNQDMGLFQLITELYPDGPLCWKGEIFENLELLGEAIHHCIPNIHPTIAEMLEHGIILAYTKNLKEDHHQLIVEIERMTELSKSNISSAYFQLFFTLSNRNEFIIEGEILQSLDDLIQFLQHHESEIDRLSKELLKSHYFFAWLKHLGNEKQLKQWGTGPIERMY
ncbi:hypothetical protein J2S13_001691 [Oikeobacillus pervagus]|uniref:Protein kinase domain-containing protein n=1 Tax=Oikeobacillus pervagus TaxID=1325931 RepID=A0AAJ1T249_9BACI|nr:serine/threonine-protein kinase [Oikeobacillus pervagus]MDQ0215291.1 hypothetical protein [Oikeobacillus pervagus]